MSMFLHFIIILWLVILQICPFHPIHARFILRGLTTEMRGPMYPCPMSQFQPCCTEYIEALRDALMMLIVHNLLLVLTAMLGKLSSSHTQGYSDTW